MPSGLAVTYTAPTGPLVSVLLSDGPANRQASAADTRTGSGEALGAGLFEAAWKRQRIGKVVRDSMTRDTKES